ncbi:MULTISPECIES: autotransporter outer membrane beta-barrel domain-containing protein [Rodentibacter]|uniref:autotransporter outer membrane beta-barrel domain-containing protein n=1 Tax=Rodentibacter TaxID=1960084 RepID=UPI001CFC5658|nr:autotransporter outer membrane beta-barrel domain-containing protein [Rodentibacter sp. JRC1]GJI56522.1 hypothetical protein HEMROJRC1_16340 [Rodentibacter sp. JRC1]
MDHKPHPLLKGLTLSAVAVALVSVSANAYEQGKGTVAKVYTEDKIEKIDTLTATENTEERIKGKFNRSGNPVRIIWYGNPKDQDGKAAQTGADNQGQIIGKVIATGQATSESEDRRGAISIDGVANGIDALGWSAPSNANDVVFKLDTVSNSGSIAAEAALQGGAAETHGDIQSYGSGNGISIIGLADFGKHNAEVGADGIADGYSGATGVSRSRTSRNSTTRTRAVAESTPSSPELERVDFEGKTVEVSLNNVNNGGLITAKIHAQADQNATSHTASYKPQFYSVATTASGNALSAASYVNTIDRQTFSEGKHNFAKLGEIHNNGYLVGKADLFGGQNTTHTGTSAANSGNGISAMAITGRFAKNRTESAVGNLQNFGEITGSLEQISGNNSNYQGFHLYSNAHAQNSGNGVAVTAESSNAQTTYPTNATLGNVQNNGRISGSAKVQAGNGMGEIMAHSYASGNGLSTFVKGNSGQISAIGNVNNSGIIRGQLEVRSGKSGNAGNAENKEFIPKVNTQQTSSTTSNVSGGLSAELCKWLAAGTPGCEAPTSATTATHQQASVQSAATVHASGNGISVWAYTESGEYGQQNARLGDIDNSGVITGYTRVWQGFSQGEYSRVDYRNNGAGIALNAEHRSAITNTGIISGNLSALLARGKIDTSWSSYNPEYRSGFKGNITNYGILAGRMIIGNYQPDQNHDQHYRYFDTADKSDYKVKNSGLYIKLNENEGIERVTVGNDISSFTKNGKTYQVINAPLTPSGKDSEKITTADENIANTIINGVGIENGALVAKHQVNLTDSIINGYKTALKITENTEVNADGTTLNVNGFMINKTEKPLAVLGDNGANKFTFGNQSRINGDIDLKGGDDELTIADSSAIFNGKTLDLGEGNDTLNFGKVSGGGLPIKVGYNVANAENLVINQETLLLANANVDGTNNITLNQDLHYQVLDPKTHALYANKADKLTLSGVGKFVVNAAKTSSEYEIQFARSQLDPKVTFATNNVLQSAVFKDGKLLIQPKVVMSAEEAKKQQEDLNSLKAQIAEAEKAKIEAEQAQKQAEQQQQAKLDALNAQLADIESKQAEAEKALQAALADHNKTKQQKQAELDSLRKELSKTLQALQNAMVTPQADQSSAQPEQPNMPTTNSSNQIAKLEQKITELNQALATKQNEADARFNTAYKDAYDSYIANWKAGGVNPLQESALTTDKSAQQANDAINRYLAETVEQNIYGAVIHHLNQTVSQQRLTLSAMQKQLKAQEWHIAAQGIFDKIDYRKTADKATTKGSMLSLHYGVNDNLTVGAHIGTDKTTITGLNQSRLSGNGVSLGAYLSKYIDRLTLTSGVMYAQNRLNGKRYINNGYNSHQFDTRTKANAVSVYTQLKYALPLSEQWQFVPKLSVAYTRFNQQAVKENGVAGLNIDALHSNHLEAGIGQEIIGTLPTTNGKAQFKVSADYRVFSGEKALQGRFRNGNQFTINTEPSRNIANIGATFGYEWHNGFSFNVKAEKALSKGGNQTIGNIKLGYTF